MRERESVEVVLSRNLAALLSHLKQHHGSGALQRKTSGPSLKTLNNIVAGRHKPTLKTLQRVASMFGIEPWQLLLPDFQVELILNDELRAVVINFTRSDASGRAAIAQIAAYSRTKN